MPITVSHVLTATTPDDTNYEIRPSHWNSSHAFTLNISATEISGLFSNANGLSFGLSVNSITGSYTRPVVSNAIQAIGSVTNSGTNTSRFAADDHVHDGVFSMGVSTGGNTIGDTRVGVGRFVLQGGNNVTLSQITGANALNTIVVSAAAGGAGNTGSISAGTTRGTLGEVVFSNSNNVSFGINGQTVTASYTAPVVSNAIQAVGSATGSGTNTSRFAADDHVHEGVFSAGVSTGGNSAGDTRVGAGQFVLAGGNNITLSQATGANGLNTISIVGGAGGAGETRMSAYAVSNTTQSSSGTIPLSLVSFAGAGQASVGITNGSVVMSVPAAFTASVTVPWDAPRSADTLPNGSLYVWPIYLPQPLALDRVINMVRVSLSSSSNSSHGGTLSAFRGIYTLNGSTLSALATGSATYAWTNTSSNSYSVLSNHRIYSCPIEQTTLTPGRYWFVQMGRTSSVNANWFTMSHWMINGLASSGSGSFMGASNYTIQSELGFGALTATTSALPSSIALSNINSSVSIGFRWWAALQYSTL